jgi:hypothetical protein
LKLRAITILKKALGHQRQKIITEYRKKVALKLLADKKY